MSRLKDLMVEIGFDVSDVEKGIGKLSKQFDNLGKEFVKKAVKRAPKDPFNIGAERTRTQKFIRQIKDLNKEVGDYQKKLKTLKTPKEFKDFQKQIQKDVTAFKRAEQQKTKTYLAEAAKRKKISDKSFQDSVKSLTQQSSSKKAKDSASVFFPTASQDLKAQKAFAEKQKRISDARIKQATGKLTTTSGKSAKDSASVFSQSFDSSDKELKAIREKNRLRNEMLGKERQSRLKASQDAQKALQKRLKDFKKSKQQEFNQHKSTNKEKLSDTERYLKRARRLEEQLRFSANFRRLPDQEKNRFEGQIKSARKLMVTEGSDYGFRKLSSDVREFRRSLIGLHTVQMGLTDSTRNMLRAYASVFALVEGTTAINRVGQDFESMRASMLAASTSAEDSQQKLAFVKKEARRLGIDLVAASRAYMQLSIAGKDSLKQDQLDDLFVSSMEAATAFGMSLDDTKGTFRAFIQI